MAAGSESGGRSRRGAGAGRRRKPQGPSIRKLGRKAFEAGMFAAELGCSRATVAAQMGVTEAALAKWLAHAEDPLSYPRDADKLLELAEAYRAARGKFEMTLAATAMGGATGRLKDVDDEGRPLPKKDPKLALEMLGRRVPRTWGVRNRLEVDAPEGGVGGIVMLPRLDSDRTRDGSDSH